MGSVGRWLLVAAVIYTRWYIVVVTIPDEPDGVGDKSAASNYINDTDPVVHVISFADVRTASTTQFNILCVALHLHLRTYRPDVANRTRCYFDNFYKGFNADMNVPQVVKSHAPPPPSRVVIRNTTLVFSTAKTKQESDWRRSNLEEQGYTVGMIQDLETLSEVGVGGYVQRYADRFGIPLDQIDDMRKYFSSWDKLRICCGLQMSQYWRWELNHNAVREEKYRKPHPFCSSVNIDEVEREFMNSTLYRIMNMHRGTREINRPSMLDKELTGSYCSWYNGLVWKEALPHNCFHAHGKCQ